VQPFSKSNLISSSELSAQDIEFLFAAARSFSKDGPAPLLKGKTVVNFFLEDSTRTRLSFEVATRRLEGQILGFSASQSSIKKGESFLDTAKNILALKPQAIVLRHSSAGSPALLAQELKIPIVNAGDGFHEHPTQGLLDAFSLLEKWGTLKGKRVVIIGDILHSRVARSNIHVLRKCGASVAVCGPPSLLPPRLEALGVDFAYLPEPLLQSADAVMTLRIQFERQNKMTIPSLSEYRRFWGMTRERAQLLKKGAIILHPGPVNRGVELDPEVADGPHSIILDQVTNGVLIRMAVLAAVIQPKALELTLKERGAFA